MNRKTDCWNKTVKRTKIDPKSKTDSEPNFIFIKTEHFFLKFWIKTDPKQKVYFETELNRANAHPWLSMILT